MNPKQNSFKKTSVLCENNQSKKLLDRRPVSKPTKGPSLSRIIQLAKPKKIFTEPPKKSEKPAYSPKIKVNTVNIPKSHKKNENLIKSPRNKRDILSKMTYNVNFKTLQPVLDERQIEVSLRAFN